jgi:hypothetical protein
MNLTIRSGPSRDDGTFGTAELDDGTIFDSLELPWRDNAPGKSCILQGSYTAQLVNSPHFGFPVWQLQFVPGRSFIEIHPANWAGNVDKGLYADLLGCIGLGHGVGVLQPPEATYAPQLAILSSRAAFAEFMQKTTGNALTVTIMRFDGAK